MKKIVLCGVDVSAKNLAVAIDPGRGDLWEGEFPNDAARAALFLPALVASQRDPRIRDFHQKLIARGKKPMQALVAVMRKLLHAIHGMFRADADFDGEKFYAVGPRLGTEYLADRPLSCPAQGDPA